MLAITYSMKKEIKVVAKGGTPKKYLKKYKLSFCEDMSMMM
jgi:hypothetical protein